MLPTTRKGRKRTFQLKDEPEHRAVPELRAEPDDVNNASVSGRLPTKIKGSNRTFQLREEPELTDVPELRDEPNDVNNASEYGMPLTKRKGCKRTFHLMDERDEDVLELRHEPEHRDAGMLPTKRKGCTRTFQLMDEPEPTDEPELRDEDVLELRHEPELRDAGMPPTKRKGCTRTFQLMDEPELNDEPEHRDGMEHKDVLELRDEPDDENTATEYGGGTLEHAIKKKVRGPTFMTKVWGRPDGKGPMKIITNSLGQPIGPTKSTFVEFLGTIARNGCHAPIHMKSWHKVPMEKKEEMLAIVKEKFDVPPGMDFWILKTLGHRWRNWKNQLKAKYFDENVPIDFQKQADQERVLEDQWEKLIAYWITDEAKCISNRNKEVRKKKTMNHRTGKKSFAQVGVVLEKADKDKKPPSRAQMFKACYINKNNNACCNDVANVVKEMDERISQLPPGSLDEISPTDVFAQVRGQERDGRVRMVGGGVAPSDIWGNYPSRGSIYRLAMHYKEAWERSEERYSELMARMVMLQETISQLGDSETENSSSVPSTSSEPSTTSAQSQRQDNSQLQVEGLR